VEFGADAPRQRVLTYGSPLSSRRLHSLRRSRALSPAALTALDFGLSVRVDLRPSQRTLFAAAQNLTAREVTSEFGEMVATLRVRSFALRPELEQLASALIANVECGFSYLVHRAALDLGDCLRAAARRCLADRELSPRAADGAFHVAERVAREVR
jgi:hypothetical protein